MVNTSCDGRKFDTMYTLGKYNNDRDNEYDYGFGNFLQLNPSLYAFLTYDFIVKIFKVKPWFYIFVSPLSIILLLKMDSFMKIND